MDLDKTMTWKDVINIWNAKSNVLERQKKKEKIRKKAGKKKEKALPNREQTWVLSKIPYQYFKK